MNRSVSTKMELKDILTAKQFKTIEASFLSNYSLSLESCDLDGKESLCLCSSPCHPYFCRVIRNSRPAAARCRQDRLRWMNIAIETGQPHMGLCHAGIVLGCVPVMDGAVPLGGLFFGKCLWEEPNESLEEELRKRLRGLHFDWFELKRALKELRIVPARRMYEAAEFLYALLYQTADLNPCVVQWRRQRMRQMSNPDPQTGRQSTDDPYPYEAERELIARVKLGDSAGAREILNTLLGVILFNGPDDTNVLKARLVELLGVLSRAAAQSGVDVNLLLNKNLDYISKVLATNGRDNLCVWISRTLDDFIENVYSSRDIGKMNRLRPGMEYMDHYYDRPITLTQIARSAHLSVSRLAHLFKEQMGITLMDYLTNVRIRHAKRLLLTTQWNCTRICFAVGYGNQSYFTRTFRRIAGITPQQFRQENKRR
jgi:two-component system response regulator YesN